MRIDETDLLAYADGHLPPQRRADVEAAVSCSAELAARVAALRASVLPYQAAYEAQPLAPPPTRLVAYVAGLVNADSRKRQRHRFAWLPVAAAFAAGVGCCAVALTLLSMGWRPASPERVSPWIQAVADYQQLYSRETLTNVTADEQLTERTINELRVADRMSVQIPDLRSTGLTFKRVQRLSFHRQPVVQIVYLPERGDPIALCITHDARADEAPRAQQLDELSTVTWRRGNLGYVLLGNGAAQTLLELAQHLAGGEVNNLYGRGGDPARGNAA